MLTEYQRYRLYEILPGLSIWVTLILAVAITFLRPLWMIYFMIVFDIYWVLKVLHFSFYLVIAWFRYRRTIRIDWGEKMRAVSGWQTKKHIVFLTLLNEEWPIIESAMNSLATATYAPEQFVIVIAGEERTAAHHAHIFARITDRFASSFGDIVGTLHPKDLPDEIPGKGSNMHFAEQEMQKYLEKKQWPIDECVVTVLDIDTICHPQYFSYLTYLYCTHPRPTRSSYQPIALYNNNMWESPAMLRLMAFGTTFWLFTSLAKQDALVTFSSHSMSWQALCDAGFHDKRIVSEDSRIFYQCLLAYDGDYEVTPMYMPVSMDTVRDDHWWQSIKNLYKQQRRWAWGAEHIPYLLWHFRLAGKKIPRWQKIKWVFVEWEGKWSWCVVALIITVFGRLPMLVAPLSIRQSTLFFNAPHILARLMTISMVGLFLSASLSFPLLPRRPASRSRHVYVIHLLQWVLLPISLIFLSAVPAIDAMTHLMFGKYLGFNVSQKTRKKEYIRQ